MVSYYSMLFIFLMVLIVEEMALAFVSAVTLSEYCR